MGVVKSGRSLTREGWIVKRMVRYMVRHRMIHHRLPITRQGAYPAIVVFACQRFGEAPMIFVNILV